MTKPLKGMSYVEFPDYSMISSLCISSYIITTITAIFKESVKFIGEAWGSNDSGVIALNQ